MQAEKCKLAAPSSLINSLINISTRVASATLCSVQRGEELLISLLGFWKGSWAAHYLLMAEVSLCGAALPYEFLRCCACLALEDAVLLLDVLVCAASC